MTGGPGTKLELTIGSLVNPGLVSWLGMDGPLNPTVGDLLNPAEFDPLNPSMGGPVCDPLNVGGPVCDPLNVGGPVCDPLNVGGPECDPLNVGGPGSWKSIKGRSSSSSSLTGDSMIASRSSGMFERSSGSFLSTLDGTSLSESDTTGGGPSGEGIDVVVAMRSGRGKVGCGRMFVAAGGGGIRFVGRVATAVVAGE